VRGASDAIFLVAAFEDEMEPLKKYDADLFGGTPAEVPETYRRSNPITFVESVKAPMLLLVGQNDPRCPSRSVDIYREGKNPAKITVKKGDKQWVIDENELAKLPEDIRREDEPLLGGDRIQNQMDHKVKLSGANPGEFDGGEERIVTIREFPMQDSISSGRINMKVGSIREMHWHPNSDEWQFYTKGRARIGMFGAHGRVEVQEVGPGDVAYVPEGFGHWIEQIGSDPTEVLVLFSNPNYQEISLSTWLAGNPMSLLRDNFGWTEAQVKELPKKNQGLIR